MLKDKPWANSSVKIIADYFLLKIIIYKKKKKNNFKNTGPLKLGVSVNVNFSTQHPLLFS